MIITIAIGVALGIFIAAGVFYSAKRWGWQALHHSTLAGGWVWQRKLRVALLVGAIVSLPIVAAFADYAGILLYENFNSTAGKYHSHPYDQGLDILKELRGTRWENNPMEFVYSRSREHLHAIGADLDWREANRTRLCRSPGSDWRPAMLIMGPECQRLANAAAYRAYDEARRNRAVSPLFPASR